MLNSSYFRRSNELATLPAGSQPKYRVVGPKVAVMEARISDLDTVIEKLVDPILYVHYFDLSLKVCSTEEAVLQTEHDCRQN